MLGQTILHYEILQKLGAGGMGEIYKAQDSRLNRFVAIKILLSSGDAERRQRFIQEAQAASSLNHPNIITIHDIISHDDKDFMVMEFITGKTLGDLIPNTGLSAPDTVRYALQMADALQAAHAAGIIHRDLKPANIMVTAAGLVKILDFGLAKLSEGSGITSLTDDTRTMGAAPLTVEGSILGTFSYMSPEQAQGKRVDPRSDIFSCGVVLYEMVTGCKAFASDSAVSTLSAILRDEPKPIAEIVPGVPPELEQIIYRAIRKEQDQRWQSMKDVQAELAALKQKMDSGISVAVVPVAKKRRGAAAVVVAIFLVVAATAGGWLWVSHHAAKPVAVAQRVPAPLSPVAPRAPEPKPSPLADPILTNQGILDMVQAKVPVPVIVGQIRSAKTSFDLSTAGVIRLTQGGVPATVIETMRAPDAPTANSVLPTESAGQSRTVSVIAGMPFAISLLEDVSADPAPGQPVHFQAAKEVRIGDTVIIANGAAVTGEVVEAAKKKFLGRAGKPTFRLLTVTAVDGSKLKIRATPGRHGDGKPDRPIEFFGHSRSKDIMAPAGSKLLAYFDGDQTVTVRR